MTTTIRALFIKFLIALVVTEVLLFITGISLIDGLSIALVLTLVTFLVADLPFLLILGNELTVIVDAVIAVPVFWGMTRLYTGESLSGRILIVLALIVAVGEWFFHNYALKTGVYK